jgi:UDP-3-O-[3-hydroxymyristoyl] glucosamine N-acyltransferase
MKLGELAAALGLAYEGDPALDLVGLAGLRDARPGDLSFVTGERYLADLAASGAGAVLAPAGLAVGRPCLRSAVPYVDFARAIELLLPRAPGSPGIHATAVVADDAELASGVAVGPYAVIGARCRIGAGTRIHAHATLYPGVIVGEHCVIHSGAHLRESVRLGDRVVIQNGAVIGSDGFGFVGRPDGSRVRVPHRSAVWLGDDVEIGANTTIDASHPGHGQHVPGSSATFIGPGVKIDNLVQIGHGCSIADGATLCAQVGLAGSTAVGRRVYMAGQAAAKGHVSIGEGSLIGGKTAVVSDIPPASQILGVPPGMDRRRWARIVAAWKRLPDLLVRVRKLEQALAERAPREP